ncbi:hypothetical protein [Herbaspirillum sp. RV1423]|uniref:immunity protein Imm33 domain-containing protein n=1 Tax=Herbaspirillum sp. RV1423 TaxID=1443993 RepID=UPI0009DCCC54|nr:hypothetical protein [Herbaspirillum sp. RV1423]
MPSDQQKTCQRFAALYMPPEINEKVGIALGTLDRLPLHAVRLQPNNGDCGWYIHGGENSDDANFCQPLHVSHVAGYCAKIIPYLALPPGWRVFLAPDYEDVWLDDKLIKNISGGKWRPVTDIR